MISIRRSSGSGSDELPYPLVDGPRGVPVEEVLLRALPDLALSVVSEGARPAGPSIGGDSCRLDDGEAERSVPATDVVRVDEPVGTRLLSSWIGRLLGAELRMR